jgi:hypothetical protein
MAKKNKSLPIPDISWACFVNISVKVFCKTLELLTITDEIKKKEDKISKELNGKLKEVCFKYKLQRPHWDAKADNEKRPDFTCRLFNPYAESVDLSEVDLHIECKCIGNNRKSSPSWILNMNYINEGINRFDSLSHEYGRGANDGVMIGYIISSTKSEIQEAINEKLPNNIQKLKFITESKVEKIFTQFFRENVKPADFTLHHIWADFTKVD